MSQPTDIQARFPAEIAAAFDDQIRVPRGLVTVGGGLLAGAMLAQGLIWTGESMTAGAEGWFFSSPLDWEEATGLTRADQTKAENKLAHRNLIHTHWIGEQKYLRVNLEAVRRELEQVRIKQEAQVMAA